MVEVGKVYSIGVNHGYDVMRHKYIENSVINIRCWHISEDHHHFEPVQYDGAVPEGRTQAMETFVVPSAIIDQFPFAEEKG